MTNATAERLSDPAWAWAPYRPDAQRPWDLRQAGHLYRRAGFAATWSELRQAQADGPQPTIDRLLHPAGADAWNREADELERTSVDPESTSTDSQWWLRRMILTPHPLQEKMTLFWRGHFALDASSAGGARLLQAHMAALRTHALGRFSDLLASVAHDPAVLVSLKSGRRARAEAGPALARRLLGSFTQGDLPVGEQDVREAVRAMSGWIVLRRDVHFAEREHDAGEKTILGQRGNWTLDDVVRIALAQPNTARHLVQKLYRWLISETAPPTDALLAPLSAAFSQDYHVGHVVETMLRSNLFFSSAAYRQRIKSPVEFALGIVRPLEELVPTLRLSEDLAALGQNLGRPPSSAGWTAGRAWINRFTLIGRSNLAAAMLVEPGAYGDRLSQLEAVKKHAGAQPEKAAQFLIDLLLQGDLGVDVRAALLKSTAGDAPQQLREIAHALVTSPEFQLA